MMMKMTQKQTKKTENNIKNKKVLLVQCFLMQDHHLLKLYIP